MTNENGLISIPFRNLQNTIESEIDLFICSASFEERCMSAPKSLDPAKVKKVLVMRNENVQGKGKEHGEKILGHFKGRAEMVFISKASPIKTADGIANAISSVNIQEKACCLVDITTMTHEALLIFSDC